MEIRTLSLQQIETLVRWAGAEGWNPGLADASAFQAADPQGFFGGFLDGEMVSGISAVAYDDRFGFVGLYITRPDMRGNGYGRRLWDHAIDYLGNRTIGLDGVPEQQANYARMGFAADYGTARWSGEPAGLSRSGASRRAGFADLPALAAFDRFPATRHMFLAKWLKAAESARVIETDGSIVAFGAARKCLDGVKVGPLFAETAEDAVRLLADLVADIGPSRIDIDVPLLQTDFIAVLEASGLTRGFETARMYRGPKPDLRLSDVFAVTSLELG